MSQKITQEWKCWAMQVNANYHNGKMPVADAEALAGPEPVKHEVQKIEDDKHYQDTIDSFLMDTGRM
jgi:hypothetical protein